MAHNEPCILVANIGNRSLVFRRNGQYGEIGIENEVREQALEKLEYHEPSKTFKSITEFLWSQRKNIDLTEWVSLNILSKLIIYLRRKNQYDIQGVYLFTTQQMGKAHRQQQDTIEAGKIIRYLLTNEKSNYGFSARGVRRITIKDKPVDANKLLIAYRNELDQIRKDKLEGNNWKLVVCDSGGTPQQKAALKLVSEYYFADRCDFWQVIEESENGKPILGETKGDVKKQTRIEYRRIIDAQQVELLIDQGEYEAASLIWKSFLEAIDESDDDILSLIDYMAARKRLPTWEAIEDESLLEFSFPAYKEPGSIAGPKLEKWIEDSKISNLIPREKQEFWKEQLGNAFYPLCEVLFLTDFFWTRSKRRAEMENGNLLSKQKIEVKNVIWHSHIFVEKFVDSYLIQYVKEPSRGRNVSRVPRLSDKLYIRIKFIKNFAHPEAQLFGQQFDALRSHEKGKGLLNQHYYTRGKQGEELRKCKAMQEKFPNNLDYLESKNIIGLDRYRNKIAHEGIGVSLEEFEAHVPEFRGYFEAWKLAFGLPDSPEDNLYYKANQQIKQLMKNQGLLDSRQ